MGRRNLCAGQRTGDKGGRKKRPEPAQSLCPDPWMLTKSG
jgi:hypothetical protein